MNEMCVSVCQYCSIWPGIYSYNIGLSSCFTILSGLSEDVKQMKQAQVEGKPAGLSGLRFV
jgi:hypothetical protein